MALHRLSRLSIRFRPRYGWLPFLMLVGALGCLAFSVLEAGWVPDDRFIIPLLVLGFIGSAAPAVRLIKTWVAGVILVALGAALSLVFVIDLWPGGALIGRGPEAIAEYLSLRVALFVDSAAGWFAAVFRGGRSTETVVFALGLALAGWLTAVFLAWSVYRMRRPFLGLTLAGLALLANTYFGQAGLYWVAIFFGLALTVGIYLTHLFREEEWEARNIDFPADVRTDILFYTAGLSIGVMALAMVIPTINFRAIADAFQSHETVIAAEQALDRAFGGIRPPRPATGTSRGEGLPRSFLIGGDPNLADTVVMTATYRADPAADLAAFHWRYTSYDEYIGSGWRRSPEREEKFDGGQPIPPAMAITPAMAPPTVGTPVRVIQQVDWTYDRRITRYTLGRPTVFSHDTTTTWRGRDDFVGALGRNNPPTRYTAETAVVVATPDELRAARLEDVPPEIRARYTNLPADIPQRVLDLAQEIAKPQGSEPLSPYDQARAIETFLHQFPYTLDLPPPPPDVDIVDYFLFDLQTGFCDYYASAMVVMARAVGLPARLGAGFMQRPPDAAGVQTIRLLDAHSWAEVYFAGVGWVEFEPTAPFAAELPTGTSATSDAPPDFTAADPPVAIPPRAPQRQFPWPWLLGVAGLALVAARLWGGRVLARFAPRYDDLDEVQTAYARLLDGAAALGVPPKPSQTPAEFTARLLAVPALDSPDTRPLRPAIERLAGLFAARQYGTAAGATDDETAAAEARHAWDIIDKPLRRLVRRL